MYVIGGTKFYYIWNRPNLFFRCFLTAHSLSFCVPILLLCPCACRFILFDYISFSCMLILWQHPLPLLFHYSHSAEEIKFIVYYVGRWDEPFWVRLYWRRQVSGTISHLQMVPSSHLVGCVNLFICCVRIQVNFLDQAVTLKTEICLSLCQRLLKRLVRRKPMDLCVFVLIRRNSLPSIVMWAPVFSG